jgi:hypothetical protein
MEHELAKCMRLSEATAHSTSKKVRRTSDIRQAHHLTNVAHIAMLAMAEDVERHPCSSLPSSFKL